MVANLKAVATLATSHFLSFVVPLPVLMKDEKRYSDLVDVLDQLEAWVRVIYVKAGLCAPLNEDHVPPGPFQTRPAVSCPTSACS